MKKIKFSIALLLPVILFACNSNDHPVNPGPQKEESVKSAGKEIPVIKRDTNNVFTGKPIVYDTTKKYIYLTFDDVIMNTD